MPSMVILIALCGGDIMTFEPNIQVPYSQTWTAGWQRKLTSDFAIEARYVGTRSDQIWREHEYNELNIVENGLLDEFRLAQQNLEANIVAGRGANFRYFGPGTGTNPLPIALAYFTGRTDATSTGGLLERPVCEQHLSAQFELRKRLSHGLYFNASYVFGRAITLQSNSLQAGWSKVLDIGTEGNVTHAFKTNWTYELPFGQGRRFGNDSGPLVERLISGWSLDGIARIQSGRDLELQGVRLVGMSEDELRDAFKIRFDHTGKLVYNLPEDIIDNTVKAFSTSATSATGYGDLGAPSGRYIAPGFGPDCISALPNGAAGGINECAPNQITVTGPTLVRFDLAAVKRTTIKGRVNFEFRAEMLNAFNSPWFTPVFSSSNDPDDHRVTGAGGSRTMQLVFRLNY